MKMIAYVKSIDTNDGFDVIDHQRVHVAFVDHDEEGDPERPEIVVSINLPKDDALTLWQLKESAIETARSYFLAASDDLTNS